MIRCERLGVTAGSNVVLLLQLQGYAGKGAARFRGHIQHPRVGANLDRTQMELNW
jgi:hypothetical protein